MLWSPSSALFSERLTEMTRKLKEPVSLIFRNHHSGFQCSSFEQHWVSLLRCLKPVFQCASFPRFLVSKIQLGGVLITKTLLPLDPTNMFLVHPEEEGFLQPVGFKASGFANDFSSEERRESLYKVPTGWGPFSQNSLHSTPTSASAPGCEQL